MACAVSRTFLLLLFAAIATTASADTHYIDYSSHQIFALETKEIFLTSFVAFV